ncbi:carbon-nitrogen hydrolase family protein [Rhizobium sp. P32RR-XVIII]|uniref:carbon-nitrogen hydrolase family protein n=1 Tax=Rhizobium sp. P32RR-XVIII TaxID=2726738 RepID=UPI001456DA0C|nr:carbon-nitrogen hydrolase family protein [Rhizobium sp. P32RR-XVIII]NLS04049.1 carbon-nitrogen hydrolase family protein [Rhizobium sp. P32RR-XVIII]
MNRTKMNLALLQMNSRPLDRAANLEHMERRLAAIAGKADFAVMPECADVGYAPDTAGWLASAEPISGGSVRALRDMARKHSIALACGVLEADGQVAGVYYSSVAVIDASGELIGVYRKSHLYPREHLWFRAGAELPVFEIAGARVGIAICFEAAIPQLFSELAMRGAELVINPSAVPVGYDYLQNLRTPARAQDSQIFTAAVNRAGIEADVHYCGGSQICAPTGELLGKAGHGTEETVIARLDFDQILPARLQEPSFRALRPELYQSLRPIDAQSANAPRRANP